MLPGIVFLASGTGAVVVLYSWLLGRSVPAHASKTIPIVGPVLPKPAPPPVKEAASVPAPLETPTKTPKKTDAPPQVVPMEPLLPAKELSNLKPLRHEDMPAQSLPFTEVGDVMGLQPFQKTERMVASTGDEITLTNINPMVGAWYVLSRKTAGRQTDLHLEVAALAGDPMKRPKLSLYADGLEITFEHGATRRYPLWSGQIMDASTEPAAYGGPQDILSPAYHFDAPLSAICDGLVYVRSQKGGSATRVEIATDLLRETRLGEWLVATAKPYLIAKPEFGEDHRAAIYEKPNVPDDTAPTNAQVDPKCSDLFLSTSNIGIATDAPDRRYYYGRWYKALHHPGIFVSVMKPSVAEKKILESYPERVARIGRHDKKERESEALVYLLAYDVGRFRFGYSLGADHPKLDWSFRAEKARKTCSGPDGFDSKKPLATVGVVPPYYEPYIVGTFAGGFKREHSAFRTGPLSKVNNGSHFGFMEEGTVFSRLLPGLATAAIGRDGSIDLFTWPNDAGDLLSRLAHARQNCLPLVQGIDADGISVPGIYLNDWGAGSWSGDQNGDFVTLRAGLAIQEHAGRRFLLFGYFTAATPNAMARVFQAYGCRYGMLL